eukprot:7242444-Alexandrium_andersonii.AAC.1
MDLGIYSELAGSLLWTFVYDGDLSGSAQTRLDTVWTRIRELYAEKQIDVRMSNLSLSMFTNPSAPRKDFP